LEVVLSSTLFGSGVEDEDCSRLRLMIKDHIATSLSIEMADFESALFYEKGGVVKLHQLFGNDLNWILDELNERLAA
jgi:hypothetical protein